MEAILPIFRIENGCILSKNGDITVTYKLELPEIFTLSSEDYENIHHNWTRALKVLPANTVVHKQDWCLESTYSPDIDEQKDSFLAKSGKRFFSGRKFLEHHTLLMITRRANGRKPSTSVFSNLLRPSIVPQDLTNQDLLQEFLNKAGQFKKLLAENNYIKVHELSNNDIVGNKELTGILEQYCFLLPPTSQPVVKDILFKPELRIGEHYLQMYTMSDIEDLPSLCGPRITYDKFSTDKSKFSIGFAAPVGLLLSCNHVYNQFLVIEDTQQTLKKMESKRRRLQSLSAYSRENAISRDATNAYLNEAFSQQRLPVRAHFNIMAWTSDPEELNNLRNMASAAIAQMDAVPRQEIKGAPQLFWAALPGNAGDLPVNETFLSFAEQAACFFLAETNYRSAAPGTGIRFADRLSSVPLEVDLFDGPRREGISSNMGTLVCGTSGGGKSMTVNHILRSLYDQGAHCVTLDIGGSYKGLCELLGGYYFAYNEKKPIKFNPFYLPTGEKLDTEKKESLKSLLVALWKQEDERFNRSEYVALSNALQGYYQFIEENKHIFPCFNTFYEYLEQKYVEVLKSHKVSERDFSVDNFLYVLRPYYAGGEFDYLLNATENLDLLSQRFVVIEMDNIKDHPILFPVCTLLLTELFLSKMRKLHGIRKVLTIDEAWKAIAKSGTAEFIKYAFKTIRKFNGIPIVITQELDDLVNSPIIKDAIINNADIKILMDMRKFMNKFDKLQETLGMSEKGKNILLSVNKDNREIYIEIGGQIMKVFKNELCPEEYFTYTTEGRERVKVLEYAEKFGSMQKGITALVAERQNNKN
ncbi:conjugation system TraG family ATPase [Chitinophagaceae bacterium OAS944]|nr:conjugation system TraG family ATPase [Chitinophagaceae bacterium OAS944]